MKNHNIWMILGCLLPLLLIFFAPAFGITNEISLFLFIIIMFGIHLIMLRNHGSKSKDHHSDSSQTNKTDNDGLH